jgi:hypothetical protein
MVTLRKKPNPKQVLGMVGNFADEAFKQRPKRGQQQNQRGEHAQRVFPNGGGSFGPVLRTETVLACRAIAAFAGWTQVQAWPIRANFIEIEFGQRGLQAAASAALVFSYDRSRFARPWYRAARHRISRLICASGYLHIPLSCGVAVQELRSIGCFTESGGKRIIRGGIRAGLRSVHGMHGGGPRTVGAI